MRRLAKFLATVGGLGYLPVAPGTAGSLVGLAIVALWPAHSHVVQWPILFFVFLLGVGSSTRVERDLGTIDPSCIIIDEVVGMWLTLLLVTPTSPTQFVVAFAGFRLFDILKPPPLKQLARLPRGWGVMLDDLGAAVYAGLAMMILKALLMGILIAGHGR